ncbi:MAG: oligosaccharide flippase family protein [Deltaproteobacteria bacterium]|nr:oligosaccharide flippase family protein [Deltaproteobacteria bacterium]
MSIAQQAVRGAAWTIASSMGSRAVSLVGTMVITHYVAPAAYGEVSVAVVLVLTASAFSNFGLGNFVIARPNAPARVAFHATVYHVLLGVLALLLMLGLHEPLGRMLGATEVGRYLPWLTVSVLFDRMGYMPERILVRDMKFRVVGLTRTVSELTYTVVAVGLAMAGLGADAIVAASVVRALLRMLLFAWASDRTKWLTPAPLSRETTRELMAFGLPMAVSGLANVGSRYWDNAIISSMFGPGVMGLYAQAYNLADVPANQVGEHIGDVLLPSMAHLPGEKRKEALIRSTGLLALVVFPLAVGLGAIAPTLVGAVFNEEWQGMAPMLLVLSALSVTRPVGWTIGSYLKVQDYPRALMAAEVFKVAALVGWLLVLGRLGPLWACCGVGLAFGSHALLGMILVQRLDKIPVRRFVPALLPPLFACVPMVAAIVGVRAALGFIGISLPGVVQLLVEVTVGASAYVGGALVLARKASSEFLTLVRKSFMRKKGAISPRETKQGSG